VKIRTSLLLAIAAVAAPPAFAQSTNPQDDPGAPREPLPYDRGYDKPQARTDAINAPNEAKRAELNAQAAAQGGPRVTADAQARYAEDIAAYESAVRAHDAALIRNEVRFQRQQRAFAEAMADWRMQVADCQGGMSAACKAPPPDPADYY
jgi:hypothetical protein